jgi:hypothetical protein
MDDKIKKAIKDFIISKLGIFGAFEFRRDVQKCPCKPCKMLLQLVTEVDSGPSTDKTS